MVIASGGWGKRVPETIQLKVKNYLKLFTIVGIEENRYKKWKRSKTICLKTIYDIVYIENPRESMAMLKMLYWV